MKSLKNHACARSGAVPPPDATKSRPLAITLTLLVALTLAVSCSKHEEHDDHDHDHPAQESAEHKHSDNDHDDGRDDDHGHNHAHDDAPESTNVTYNPKTGLTFSAETAAALDLTTTRIAVRPLAHRITLNATVIDPGPPVQVTALVAPAVADDMESHAHDGVRLLAVNRALTHATAQVEVTFALTAAASPAHSIGDTLAIPLTGPAEQKLTIPNTAILRTIEGTFAYTHAGNAYRRTPITLGVTDGTYTEILTGLTDGAEIAATAIEQLWLTELRLTKGGGHSH